MKNTATLPSAGQAFTINETAAILRVSRSTLERWTREGRLRFFQPSGPTGKRLVPQSEIERLLSGAKG